MPPPETRELRDLARYRVKLVEECNRTHNRIHKVLEDACIKLDTVATNILGASGRRMIRAIIDGKTNPDWLADKAQTALRGKMPELRLALRGRVTDHHRMMLRELMQDLEFSESKIERLDKTLASRVDADADAVRRSPASVRSRPGRCCPSWVRT